MSSVRIVSMLRDIVNETFFKSTAPTDDLDALIEQGIKYMGGSLDVNMPYSLDNDNPDKILQKLQVEQRFIDDFHKCWSDLGIRNDIYAKSYHAIVFLMFHRNQWVIDREVVLNPMLFSHYTLNLSRRRYRDIDRMVELVLNWSHALSVLGYPMIPSIGVPNMASTRLANRCYKEFYEMGIDPKFSARFIVEPHEPIDFKLSEKNFSLYGYTDRSFDVIPSIDLCQYIRDDISFMTAFQFSDAGYTPKEANNFIESGAYDKDNPSIPQISWYREWNG